MINSRVIQKPLGPFPGTRGPPCASYIQCYWSLRMLSRWLLSLLVGLAVMLFAVGSASPDEITSSASGTDSAAGADAKVPAPPARQQQTADEVIALIGGSKVTTSDLVQFARKQPLKLNLLASREGRVELLRELIEIRLLNRAAIEAAGLEPGYKKSELVEARIKMNRTQFAPDEVSDSAIKAYYDAHREELGIPSSVHIRDIFFPVPTDADAEAKAAVRQQAADTLQRAKAGTSFEDLASKLAHTKALRLMKGDEQYLPLYAYPYLKTATKGMKEGDFSEIIALDGGYQIFQFLGRREGILLTFNEMKGRVRDYLGTESAQRKRRDFVREYGNKQGVRIVDSEYADAWPSAAASTTVR
jgi:parvulin-like peptidyl-prolyl isomerase